MTPEFRAWDKKRKEYFHITQLWNGGTKEGSFTFDGWKDNYGNSGFIDTVILEQYTGLKDVNGNKIFEGDIVKWGNMQNSIENPVRVAAVNLNPDICFNSNVGIFEYGDFAYKRTDKYLTVIVNIHENPELLEVE